MDPAHSPPRLAFRRELAGREFLDFAEVRLTPETSGYELRHGADAGRERSELLVLTYGDLRELAQTTATGAFRPIKTAPNLRRGWWCRAATEAELEEALDALYPGALTDWWAAGENPAPVQHFREFAGRQTGMYRGIRELSDADAAAVIRAGCAVQFCLRRRVWSVAGLAPDAPEAGKSVIPCLEPCPVLLEFARQGRRLQVDAAMTVALAPGEIATLLHALDRAGDPSTMTSTVREGDLSQPANPRRIRLLRDRLQGLLPVSSSVDAKE